MKDNMGLLDDVDVKVYRAIQFQMVFMTSYNINANLSRNLQAI